MSKGHPAPAPQLLRLSSYFLIFTVVALLFVLLLINNLSHTVVDIALAQQESSAEQYEQLTALTTNRHEELVQELKTLRQEIKNRRIVTADKTTVQAPPLLPVIQQSGNQLKQPPIAYKWDEIEIRGHKLWVATEPDYAHNLGSFDEERVSQTIQLAMKDGQCQNRTHYMLDVGANAGFFGLMALAMGCRVEFFEPQPACNHLIANQIQANQFQVYATLHMNYAASDDTIKGSPSGGSPSSITVGGTGCNVGFISKKEEVMNEEWHSKAKQEMFGKTEILGVSLDTVVLGEKSTIPPNADILLIKIDTEGSEILISRGMQKLLKSGRVHAFTVEISPPFQQEFGLSTDDCTEFTMQFLEAGYTGYMLSGVDKSPMESIEKKKTPLGALPPFPKDPVKVKEIWDDRLKAKAGTNVWFISEKGKKNMNWEQ